jgi:hypothetical protein
MEAPILIDGINAFGAPIMTTFSFCESGCASNTQQAIWSLNGNSAPAGTPVQGIAKWYNVSALGVNTNIPSENYNFSVNEYFPKGTTIGSSNGITGMGIYNAYYGSGDHTAGAIQGEYYGGVLPGLGIAFLAPDLVTHDFDITNSGVAASVPFSAPSITATGLTPGTAAICANGTGGAFTNVGCATATLPSIIQPALIYSHAGTQLPACASGYSGAEAAVSDATALFPGTAYSPSAGAGGDTVRVQCTYAASVFAWQTM